MHSLEDDLVWFPKWGFGYFPVKENPYNQEYFDKYIGYESTQIGYEINQARLSLTNDWRIGTLLDVGVGSGTFIREVYGGKGFDINPAAVHWLKETGLYSNIQDFGTMTFWDSLEHIHNPETVLRHIQNRALISCPIYKNKDHVLKSKHFRPDEHFWYWTEGGLIEFMYNFGFILIESNNVESYLGREDIGTFVFARI